MIKFSHRCLFYRNGHINVVSLYLHRILRLVPMLAVSILFVVSLYRFCGSGPLWRSLVDVQQNACENNWWATLLHVQNYVNSEVKYTDLVYLQNFRH